MEHAIYLTYTEALQCGIEDEGDIVVAVVRQLHWMVSNTTQVLGQAPRIVYPDESGIFTDLSLPPCQHEHQGINDRCLITCNDCGKDLGR